jgi:hypothetical protein
MTPPRLAAFAVCLLLAAGGAGATPTTQLSLPGAGGLVQATFPLRVSDDTATAVIELPGGYAVDLTISFEEVVGLHSGALEVSARTVAPADPALLARLPAGSLAAIPAGFPVLLQIEPASGSTLSFSGVVTISLHTHNLNFVATSPLALYSASAGGPFRDITRSVGMGSYRVDGSGGGFSEFLIAADGRPIDAVIQAKLTALAALLAEHASTMDAAVLDQLRQRLDDAAALYLNGVNRGAIGVLTAFEQYVRAQSGRAIPDTWSALGGATNVAGTLRAAADSLQFSLTVKDSQPR